MNSQASSRARLSTLDLVCSVMDSRPSPLDFTVVLHLTGTPGLEALRAGARSARNRYPTTGSYIDKDRWVRCDELTDGVKVAAPINGVGATNLIRAIEEFIDGPFDLRKQMPVQQLVIINGSGKPMTLVTRFHHAVADGLSAAMWLGHQLQVAYGHERAVTEASPFQDLSLRTLPSPVKKSRFAYDGPSDRLWTSCASRSGARRWLTIKIAATDLRERCRRRGGFTYNDLLATCTLEILSRWNRMHGVDRGQKIGLWLPVNIRQRSSVGFGNGTSRIRLYARYAGATSLVDKCREIRRQVSWSNRHGEWVVPPVNALARLPRWAIRPFLRCYLNRPSVDMATGVFSHAERWTEGNSEVFQHVEKIECIGLLHSRQCLAVNGVTHQGWTWLTFTYDPGLLFAEDIQQLAEMYQERIALAQRELA